MVGRLIAAVANEIELLRSNLDFTDEMLAELTEHMDDMFTRLLEQDTSGPR